MHISRFCCPLSAIRWDQLSGRRTRGRGKEGDDRRGPGLLTPAHRTPREQPKATPACRPRQPMVYLTSADPGTACGRSSAGRFVLALSIVPRHILSRTECAGERNGSTPVSTLRSCSFYVIGRPPQEQTLRQPRSTMAQDTARYGQMGARTSARCEPRERRFVGRSSGQTNRIGGGEVSGAET